jgi:hypothetical protein
VDLVPPLGQTPLGQEKDALVGADSAPDCLRNRQNQIVQFARPDYSICPVSSRSFWFFFISCANNVLGFGDDP